MKGDKRQTRTAWALAVLITLALVLSLLLPLVGAAQEADEDVPTTEVLADVPTTGGSRMGPVVQASSRIAAPEPEPELPSRAGHGLPPAVPPRNRRGRRSIPAPGFLPPSKLDPKLRFAAES